MSEACQRYPWTVAKVIGIEVGFDELHRGDGYDGRRRLGPFSSWMQLSPSSRRSAQMSDGLAVAQRRRMKNELPLRRDLWPVPFACLPARIGLAGGLMWRG